MDRTTLRACLALLLGLGAAPLPLAAAETHPATNEGGV